MILELAAMFSFVELVLFHVCSFVALGIEIIIVPANIVHIIVWSIGPDLDGLCLSVGFELLTISLIH